MDSLTSFRTKIKLLLSEIADFERKDSPPSGVEPLLIFDEERDCYLLYSVGWTRKHRVSSVAIFIRIIDGEIWVEEDWTQEEVAQRLMDSGIPKDVFRFGFHDPLLVEKLQTAAVA